MSCFKSLRRAQVAAGNETAEPQSARASAARTTFLTATKFTCERGPSPPVGGAAIERVTGPIPKALTAFRTIGEGVGLSGRWQENMVSPFKLWRVSQGGRIRGRGIRVLDALPRGSTGKILVMSLQNSFRPVRRESRRRYRCCARCRTRNAVNAVAPLRRQGYATLPVFAFGWPSSEAALVVVGAWRSVPPVVAYAATSRGCGADRVGAYVISWGLLGFCTPQRQSQHCFEDAAGGARRELRSDRGRGSTASAGGVLRTSWSRRQYVNKADTIRYGPHQVNVADIWRRADLPADGKAPCCSRCPVAGGR